MVARNASAERIITHPWFWRCIALFAAVAFIAIHQISSNFQGSLLSSSPSSENNHAGKHEEHEDDVLSTYRDPFSTDRCSEVDLKDLKSQPATTGTRRCNCPDPLAPIPRDDIEWKNHHDVMVEEVKAAKDLDVVIIGDSITERFRGTKSGTNPMPEYKAVFDAHFNPAMGGKVNGMALGSASDITPETMWHLENGWITDSLHPKLWVLLIGTNDLGRSGCSKRNALVGILHIADHLHKMRPDVPILFHGLLPRDGPDGERFSTDDYWDKIMWINRELKKVCNMHKNWYYMDVSRVFLQRNKDTGNVHINKDIMPDGLHPNEEGYKIWVPRIAHNVKRLLEKQD